MGVYVDEPIYERYGLRWCHLTADSVEELHGFAARLGLKRSRFQTKPSRPWVDHYDVTENTRREAVALGAVEITIRELGAQLARKREIVVGEWPGGRHDCGVASIERSRTPRDGPATARAATWNSLEAIAEHRGMSPEQRVRKAIAISQAALRLAQAPRIDAR